MPTLAELLAMKAANPGKLVTGTGVAYDPKTTTYAQAKAGGTTPTPTVAPAQVTQEQKTANVPNTPTYTPTAVKPTAVNNEANINAMYDMRKQAAVNALKQRYDTTMAGLNQEGKALPEQYAGQRSQTSVASQMQGRNMAEFMANRGLTRSGANAQSELSRGISLQNNIGALRLAEVKALEDVARRKQQTEAAYASDVANAELGAKADALNTVISQNDRNYDRELNQYNADRQFNYGMSRDMVGDNRYANELAYSQGRDAIGDARYNDQMAYTRGRDTVGDQRYASEQAYNRYVTDRNYNRDVFSQDRAYDFQANQADLDNAYREWQKGISEAGLTGDYNGARTIDGQQFDFNKGVTTAGLTGMYDGARTLDGLKYDQSVIDSNRDYALRLAASKEKALKEKGIDSTAYSAMNSYIGKVYSTTASGRTTLSQQDKNDINKYTALQYQNGVDPTTVNAIRSLYGLNPLGMLPDGRPTVPLVGR